MDEPLRFYASSIENTGVVKTRHDGEKRGQPAIPFRVPASARLPQCGEAYSDHVWKVPECFAASSGSSIATADNFPVG